jgi:hypothetical protein
MILIKLCFGGAFFVRVIKGYSADSSLHYLISIEIATSLRSSQ